jgi:NADPH:quinone reductase-like Zn-dependent oxidoreductase
VESIGADHVIDYTQTDFTQGEATYDVIFDAVGKISSAQAKQVLKPNGKYLTIKSIIKEKREELFELQQLAESGQLTAVIDRTYPLEGIAEAHRYVEKGHKKGNLVIDLFKPRKTSKVSLGVTEKTSEV